jgi:hypothetical protein
MKVLSLSKNKLDISKGRQINGKFEIRGKRQSSTKLGLTLQEYAERGLLKELFNSICLPSRKQLGIKTK